MCLNYLLTSVHPVHEDVQARPHGGWRGDRRAGREGVLLRQQSRVWDRGRAWCWNCVQGTTLTATCITFKQLHAYSKTVIVLTSWINITYALWNAYFGLSFTYMYEPLVYLCFKHLDGLCHMLFVFCQTKDGLVSIYCADLFALNK